MCVVLKKVDTFFNNPVLSLHFIFCVVLEKVDTITRCLRRHRKPRGS